jgi:predicted O-methyltransferase YrrM
VALELWSAVDRYISGLLVPDDPVLDSVLRECAAAGLPEIHVSRNQGKMLQILAQSAGARSILEIGTLGGYSTIWLARALPKGGRLVTLEYESKHARVAARNIANAGFAGAVELRVGRAQDTLPELAAEGQGPFDFIFIDADKQGYPEYFTWAMRLSRPGSLIVADNVVRNGGVADAASQDPSIQGVRRMNELVAKERRVSATAIQTVGAKGYDGFMLALVTSGDGGA